jgi:branched-chain amino acid transport system ATP-binding protein
MDTMSQTEPANNSTAVIAAEQVVRVDGVGKQFGGVWAVSDTSVSVAENEVLGIIGPNGAGKTTLFNLIAGAFPPSSGRIYFRGKDITRMAAHRRARHGIGRTFQLTRPFVSMSVRDNLRTAALACGARSAVAHQRADRGLEYLGLGPLRDKMGGDLNAVECKRVEVARALTCEPSLLLLDEIFSGSNAEEVDELADLVRRLHQDGLTILVIEHNVRAIRAVADRVVAMNAGQVISEGTAEEVFSDPGVVESYLGQHSKA